MLIYLYSYRGYQPNFNPPLYFFIHLRYLSVCRMGFSKSFFSYDQLCRVSLIFLKWNQKSLLSNIHPS
jgi:hypothetical protein